MKKQGSFFDVTVGAYDNAEVRKLLGTYMLILISKNAYKNDFGLFRNDGLGVVKNK